jgi:hypothetical protein
MDFHSVTSQVNYEFKKFYNLSYITKIIPGVTLRVGPFLHYVISW